MFFVINAITAAQIFNLFVLPVFFITYFLILGVVSFYNSRRCLILSSLNVVLYIVALISFRNNNTVMYLIAGLSLVNALYIGYENLTSFLIKKRVSQKTLEQLKNDTFDMFFQIKNKKIINCSTTVANIVQLSRKDIDNKDFWDFFFKNFNIKKINNDEFIISNALLFTEHIDEAISKYKMYKFTIDILLPGNEYITHYVGLIQPINFGKKIVAHNIYLYQDKNELVNKVLKKLEHTSIEITKQKNVQSILMSMSEGVGLYYDYQEKVYFPTQSFINYVDSGKKSYTVQEFLNMMHPDDREKYYQATETTNSMNVSRFKFRLYIKGLYFNCLEDAIYLDKECNEYVSLVHVLGTDDEEVVSDIISTPESLSLLDDLSKKSATQIVYSTQDLLKKGLSDDK